MTTYSIERQTGPNPALLLLLVAVLGAAVYIMVETRSHAVQKHGREAVAIRQSCDNGGRVQVWRSQSWRQDNKFFEVCRLQDGRLGLRIIACQAGRWVEVTSFIAKGALGNGTWARTREYLSARSSVWKGRLSEVCK